MKSPPEKAKAKKISQSKLLTEGAAKMYVYNFVKNDNIYDMWTYLNRADRDAAFEKAAEYAKAEGYRLYENTDEVEL